MSAPVPKMDGDEVQLIMSGQAISAMDHYRQRTGQPASVAHRMVRAVQQSRADLRRTNAAMNRWLRSALARMGSNS